MNRERKARVERVTHETQILVELDVDGIGVVEVATGVPFFDHIDAQEDPAVRNDLRWWDVENCGDVVADRARLEYYSPINHLDLDAVDALAPRHGAFDGHLAVVAGDLGYVQHDVPCRGHASSFAAVSPAGVSLGTATCSSINLPTRTSVTPSNPSAGSDRSIATPCGSRMPFLGVM